MLVHQLLHQYSLAQRVSTIVLATLQPGVVEAVIAPNAARYVPIYCSNLTDATRVYEGVAAGPYCCHGLTMSAMLLPAHQELRPLQAGPGSDWTLIRS
jgi:hypothetical protein